MPFIKTKTGQLKAARPGSVESQIRADLARIQQSFNKVLKRDAEFATAEAELRQAMADISAGRRGPLDKASSEVVRTQFASRLLTLNVAVGDLFKTSEDAYRAYPKEVDSARVGVAVGAAFRAGANKRKP